MALFQVIEVEEGIEQAILCGLDAYGRPSPIYSSMDRPALLVVSGRAVERGLELPAIMCRTALLPGGIEGNGALQAASAVSYGLSARDTLTISSREREQLWVALQRELVTVDGQVVERQEFPIKDGSSRGEGAVLAVVGALLLLGVPPEEVGKCLGC